MFKDYSIIVYFQFVISLEFFTFHYYMCVKDYLDIYLNKNQNYNDIHTFVLLTYVIRQSR